MVESIWQVSKYTPIDEKLIKKYKLTPIVEKILGSRGIDTDAALSAFFETSNLHDPFLMHGMEKTVKRIKHAITNEEPILVYGDYDADGVSSVTVLVTALKQLGAQVGWYIPNRFTEGYGPNEDAFLEAIHEGVKLIITVDNGIKGHHEVEVAKEHGVDVIITDHHEIGDTLPNAYAILHPEHPDGDYPFKKLAGVGVSYKLACALTGSELETMLPFVAIGTIADLVLMQGENRALVKRGLKIMQDKPPIGIQALLDEANFKGEIDEDTIGFIIGPRLNAVGRLDDARMACELLQVEDENSAKMMAEEVNGYNDERKQIVNEITETAKEEADEKIKNGARFLVLAKEGWHEGVLGIVASKLVETYHMPVMILNIDYDQDFAKGSARSVPQISMYEAIDSAQEYVSKFGGHDMAAGLTLPIDQVENLEKSLNQFVEHKMNDDTFEKIIPIDAILTHEDITVKNIQALSALKPFGMGFKSPIFGMKDAKIDTMKQIGQNNNHLKLTLDSNLNALMWSKGELFNQLSLNHPIDVAFQLQLNEWNNNITPQLILSDIMSASTQWIDFRNKHPKTFSFLKNENVAYIINDNQKKLNQNYYYYGESVAAHDKIVFRDLPNHLELFYKTLQSINASVIYVIFFKKHSIYFEGMPSMDKFKMLFKFIMHYKTINLKVNGMKLLERIGVSFETFNFMIAVYEELNLIRKSNETIELNEIHGKVDILSANIYHERLNALQIEKKLLYSNLDEIKQLLEQ